MPDAKSLLVVTEGAFGELVIDNLSEYQLDFTLVHLLVNEDTPHVQVGGSSFVVLASSKPMRRLTAALEKSAGSGEFGFLPAIMYPNCIQVGPIMSQTSQCCWTCFRQRLANRTGQSDIEKAIERYSADVRYIPSKGFLHAFSILAAARIAQVLEFRNVASRANQVWEFTFDSATAEVGSPLGQHGCMNCGLRHEASSRSIALLPTSITSLSEV